MNPEGLVSLEEGTWCVMEGRPRGESGSIRFAVRGKIFRSASMNRFPQLCIKKIQQCEWAGVRNDDGVSVTQKSYMCMKMSS